MIYMNTEILHYVEKIAATLLNDLVTTDTANIYTIATAMIAEHEAAFEQICQAYEVVKHNLLG